jgi:hypothetical protein
MLSVTIIACDICAGHQRRADNLRRLVRRSAPAQPLRNEEADIARDPRCINLISGHQAGFRGISRSIRLDWSGRFGCWRH